MTQIVFSKSQNLNFGGLPIPALLVLFGGDPDLGSRLQRARRTAPPVAKGNLVRVVHHGAGDLYHAKLVIDTTDKDPSRLAVGYCPEDAAKNSGSAGKQ